MPAIKMRKFIRFRPRGVFFNGEVDHYWLGFAEFSYGSARWYRAYCKYWFVGSMDVSNLIIFRKFDAEGFERWFYWCYRWGESLVSKTWDVFAGWTFSDWMIAVKFLDALENGRCFIWGIPLGTFTYNIYIF